MKKKIKGERERVEWASELIEFVDADDEMSDRTKERCVEAINKHRRQRWR